MLFRGFVCTTQYWTERAIAKQAFAKKTNLTHHLFFFVCAYFDYFLIACTRFCVRLSTVIMSNFMNSRPQIISLQSSNGHTRSLWVCSVHTAHNILCLQSSRRISVRCVPTQSTTYTISFVRLSFYRYVYLLNANGKSRIRCVPFEHCTQCIARSGQRQRPFNTFSPH